MPDRGRYTITRRGLDQGLVAIRRALATGCWPSGQPLTAEDRATFQAAEQASVRLRAKMDGWRPDA